MTLLRPELRGQFCLLAFVFKERKENSRIQSNSIKKIPERQLISTQSSYFPTPPIKNFSKRNIIKARHEDRR